MINMFFIIVCISIILKFTEIWLIKIIKKNANLTYKKNKDISMALISIIHDLLLICNLFRFNSDDINTYDNLMIYFSIAYYSYHFTNKMKKIFVMHHLLMIFVLFSTYFENKLTRHLLFIFSIVEIPTLFHNLYIISKILNNPIKFFKFIFGISFIVTRTIISTFIVLRVSFEILKNHENSALIYIQMFIAFLLVFINLHWSKLIFNKIREMFFGF